LHSLLALHDCAFWPIPRQHGIAGNFAIGPRLKSRSHYCADAGPGRHRPFEAATVMRAADAAPRCPPGDGPLRLMRADPARHAGRAVLARVKL